MRMLANRRTEQVFRVIGRGVLIAAAGTAMALGGAAAAGAQPGVVDVQSGSSVDADGTWGDIDADGTWGDMRGMTKQSSDSHDIVSDACAIMNKGCVRSKVYDFRTISAISGWGR